MERLRRSISWLLALTAAVALVLAGMQSARAAPEALRDFTVLNLTLVAADLRDPVLLAAAALGAGTCAILLAPHRARGAVEIVPDGRWRRIWDRDMQPGTLFAQMDTGKREDRPTEPNVGRSESTQRLPPLRQLDPNRSHDGAGVRG
jgi:hypothetical protein